MLKNLIKIDEMPKHLDASDGLAAAVCHFYQRNSGAGSTKYSDWSAFLKANPSRKAE